MSGLINASTGLKFGTGLQFQQKIGGSGLDLITAWTPALLTGLQGWWEGNAAVFHDLGLTPATNGQTVQQWNDQSGKSNNLLNNLGLGSGTLPTYATNSLNSLPTITYSTAVQSQVLLTNTLNLGGTTASIFAVVKGSTPNANARFANFTATGQSDDFNNAGSAIFGFLPGTTTIESFRNGALSSGTVSDGTWFQFGSIFDGVNSTVYINGTAQTPAANSDTFAATGRVNIGGRFESGGPVVADGLTGSVAEVIFTNTAISVLDRANIKSYFTTKWGV